MPRTIVLDTSCVRGTSRAAINALIRRGFVLRVSGIAIAELAVRLSSAEGEEAGRERLRRRMAFLSTLLEPDESFSPTHMALIDKLGGTLTSAARFAPVPYERWLESMNIAWTSLASGAPLEEHVARFVGGIAGYAEETGADFAKTVETIAEVGPSGRQESEATALLAKLFAADFERMIHFASGPSVGERFDAYFRLQGLHAARADGRASGRYRRIDENHASDLTLLHHIAEGHVVATQDYELIEWVDACGTRQAPWVRTVGELLAGRAPHGPPWAYSATIANKRHRARTRATLRERDAAAERMARAEDIRSED